MIIEAQFNEFLQRLRAAVRGEVLTDQVSRGLYATDASQYQIWPQAVVVPRDRAEALATIRLCAEHGVPILARGGGTSLSGQAIGPAVVLDFSKYMNRLLELNTEERWARVEPGLVRDELNTLLRGTDLHFAPDPATSNRATVGGMIANNSGGMRSLRYGTTIDHVLEVDVALSDGSVVTLGNVDEHEWAEREARPGPEGAIHRVLRETIETHRAEIAQRYSKARRRSSGYMLDHFLGPRPWNLARLISASEGTLGVVLEARVKLEPMPRHSGLCVVQFATTHEMLAGVGPLVEHGPTSVELLDDVILGLARESLLARDLCWFLVGQPAAILVVEFQDDDAQVVADKLRTMVDDLRARGIGYAWPVMTDKAEMAQVWMMRKNGLGLMTTIKGDRKPVPFIEDAAVPLPELPGYIAAVREVCRRHGRPVSIFAHAGVGLIHVRPMLDLHKRGDVELMARIADEVFELVLRHRGALSGEHGDGIVRGGFNKRYFGPRLYEAFRRIKATFDPAGLMNPGKIIDTPPMTEQMRFHGDYAWPRGTGAESEEGPKLATAFHFREDGGLRRAVEVCTGVGACRKTGSGVMCPSYIATRDEEHSTRGRANALRLAMTGQLGPDALASERLYEVLALCLSCKGCKAECPNAVDLAKLKSEALHQRHKALGTTLRERMVGDSPALAARLAGPLAPLVNFINRTPPMKWALERFVGFDARRTLPAYAREKLSHWLERRNTAPLGQPPASPAAHAPGESDPGAGVIPDTIRRRRTVALFADTYAENHEAALGRAAVEVLEAAGYEVVLAHVGCCQRPAISKGLLDQARTEGERTLRGLDRFVSRGMPILVLEPSCASALTDDLPDLVEDYELGRRVAAHVRLLDAFLAEELRLGMIELPWKQPPPSNLPPGGKALPAAREVAPEDRILVHGHCHQKALYKMRGTADLLGWIPGARVEVLDTGCCGMAGAFGYEKEHYELSMKVGEDRLFPALRKAPAGAKVCANGFSCRHQVADATGRQAKHAIELVHEALEL